MKIKRRKFLKDLASITVLSILGVGGLTPIVKRLAEREKQSGEKSFEPPLEEMFREWDFAPTIPIRPPGAVEELEFVKRCIGCGACLNACHVAGYDAIAIRDSEIRDFGTVFIKDMRDFPCELCMKCVVVCPTSALKKVSKENVKIGMAMIDFSLCLGWNGDVCLSCSKACPFGASVFEFYNSEWGNQPYINEKCVGCGLCVKYCPVGGSAIRVIAVEDYLKVREKYLTVFKNILSMTSDERYSLVYEKNMSKLMERGRVVEREYQ